MATTLNTEVLALATPDLIGAPGVATQQITHEQEEVLSPPLPGWVLEVSKFWTISHLADWRRINAFYLYTKGFSLYEASAAVNIPLSALKSVIRTTKVYTHTVPWRDVVTVFTRVYSVLRTHPSIIEETEGTDPFGRVKKVRYCIIDGAIIKSFKSGYEHIKHAHKRLVKKLIERAHGRALPALDQ